MSNEMISVLRADLQQALRGEIKDVLAAQRKLRALLAKPAEPRGGPRGHAADSLYLTMWPNETLHECEIGNPKYAACLKAIDAGYRPATQHQGEPSRVAESVASMVTDWVETGIKMGTDWRNGLPGIIQKRIARFDTEHQGEPVRQVKYVDSFAVAGWRDVDEGTYAELRSNARYKSRVLYTRPAEQPAPVAVVLPSADDLRSIIRKAARDADMMPGANYYTAAELAAEDVVSEVARLNPPQQ